MGNKVQACAGHFFAILLLLAVGSGCTINRDILFQTTDEFEFDELAASVGAEYRIAPNDFLSFQLFSNDGQRLLAATAGSMEGGAAGQNLNQMLQQQRNGGVQYLVQPDGRVKFPEIGWVEVEGLTLEQAEALAGGVSGRGDAAKVKLIRRTDEGNKVYFMDLSTIAGLRDAQTIVQANDIIYVEPVPEIAREALNDMSPVASIVSSLSVFGLYFCRLKAPETDVGCAQNTLGGVA